MQGQHRVRGKGEEERGEGWPTHSTPRLLAEDLLPRDPAVLVGQLHPAAEDVEAEVVVPRADESEVEALVPVEAPREEAAAWRRREELRRVRRLDVGRRPARSVGVGVPLLRVRAVDERRAVEVADAADEVGRDGARERLLPLGQGRDRGEERGEALVVRGGCGLEGDRERIVCEESAGRELDAGGEVREGEGESEDARSSPLGAASDSKKMSTPHRPW